MRIVEDSDSIIYTAGEGVLIEGAIISIDTTQVALADHNHDELYSAIDHDHDSRYAASGHNHDDAYAAINHDHDSRYAARGHNHDSLYSNINHGHSGVYAAFNHNHSGVYAASSHTHSASDISGIAINSSLSTGTKIADYTIGNTSGSLYAPAGSGSGSVVTITPSVSSGTKIADYSIDGTAGSLYAPASSGSGSVVTITPSVSSGTKIADYSIDGTAGSLYAPSGSGSGSVVTITPSVSSGTKIADYSIDGTTGSLYAPSGSGGGTTIPEHYLEINIPVNSTLYTPILPLNSGDKVCGWLYCIPTSSNAVRGNIMFVYATGDNDCLTDHWWVDGSKFIVAVNDGYLSIVPDDAGTEYSNYSWKIGFVYTIYRASSNSSSGT